MSDINTMQEEPARVIYHCRSADGAAHALGVWEDETFRVLKGSTAKGSPWIGMTKDFVKRGVLVKVPRQKVYEFTRDYVFPKPSPAAEVILNRTANGWLEWRDAKGRSMRDC